MVVIGQLKFRQPARKLSLRKRFLALTSGELSRGKIWNSALLKVCRVLKCKRLSPKIREIGIGLAKIVLGELINTVVEPDTTVESIPDRKRDIESFSESECWNFFGTRKEDLPRLFRALQFDETCSLENRSSMPGEEVMLRGLYELVSGNDQNEIAVNIFGRDQSTQSRAFKYFINHIYHHFLDLVTDNLDW